MKAVASYIAFLACTGVAILSFGFAGYLLLALWKFWEVPDGWWVGRLVGALLVTLASIIGAGMFAHIFEEEAR